MEDQYRILKKSINEDPVLNEAQKRALLSARKHCKLNEQESFSYLQQALPDTDIPAFIKCTYTVTLNNAFISFPAIAEAPLTIHLSPRVLPLLMHDTHYRNQFETKTSNARYCHASRTGWENRLFNFVYDKSSGFDRVKYLAVIRL